MEPFKTVPAYSWRFRKIVKTPFDKFFRCAHLGLKTVQYHYKFLITEEAFLKVSFLM